MEKTFFDSRITTFFTAGWWKWKLLLIPVQSPVTVSNKQWLAGLDEDLTLFITNCHLQQNMKLQILQEIIAEGTHWHWQQHCSLCTVKWLAGNYINQKIHPNKNIIQLPTTNIFFTRHHLNKDSTNFFRFPWTYSFSPHVPHFADFFEAFPNMIRKLITRDWRTCTIQSMNTEINEFCLSFIEIDYKNLFGIGRELIGIFIF